MRPCESPRPFRASRGPARRTRFAEALSRDQEHDGRADGGADHARRSADQWRRTGRRPRWSGSLRPAATSPPPQYRARQRPPAPRCMASTKAAIADRWPTSVLQRQLAVPAHRKDERRPERRSPPAAQAADSVNARPTGCDRVGRETDPDGSRRCGARTALTTARCWECRIYTMPARPTEPCHCYLRQNVIAAGPRSRQCRRIDEQGRASLISRGTFAPAAL